MVDNRGKKEEKSNVSNLFIFRAMVSILSVAPESEHFHRNRPTNSVSDSYPLPGDEQI